MTPKLNVERISTKGDPLLMLHGWGKSLETMRPMGELLAPHAQVHLIDLPGFGRSEIPESSWSAFDYAARILKYMDQEKIATADIAGHSFGGKVALCFALRYPDRIKKLVLMASAGLKRSPTLLRQLKLSTLKYGGKALKLIDRSFDSQLFSEYFTPRFGSADYQQAGALRPILVRSVNEDLSSEIPNIRAPTLLLWGENDTETPPEMAYRLQKLLPQSRLILLPHKGHLLFQDVGAHLCTYYMLPFLQNPEAL